MKKDNPEGLSDWFKKTVLTGVGAVFMSEEGIRKTLSDLKMPKNMIAAIVAQAERTKTEMSGLIATEVRNFLQKIEVDQIIRKALKGQSIEINARITFLDDAQRAQKKGASEQDDSPEKRRKS